MDISRIGNTTIGSRIGNIMIHDGNRMGNRSGNRIGNRIGMMVMVMEDGISLVTGMMVMVMMMVMAIMEDGITGSQNDNWTIGMVIGIGYGGSHFCIKDPSWDPKGQPKE